MTDKVILPELQILRVIPDYVMVWSSKVMEDLR